MKRIICIILAVTIIASLTACSIAEVPATTHHATDPTQASTFIIEDAQDDATSTSPSIEDQSCLTTELLTELTWEELLASSWSPVTSEDKCLLEIIPRLDCMGRVFRKMAGYRIITPVDDSSSHFNKNRMHEKLQLLLDAFNASPHTYWCVRMRSDFNIDFSTGDPIEVVVYLSLGEFEDVKLPVWYVGEMVVVTQNENPPAFSSEGFGFGSRIEVTSETPNPVNVGDIMLVSGFSYLTEMGEILHEEVLLPYEFCWGCETCKDTDDCPDCPDCNPFEYLGAAVPRKTDEGFYMVNLSTIDGTSSYWFLPETFIRLSDISAQDLSAEELQNLSEKFPDIDNIEDLLRQDSPVIP